MTFRQLLAGIENNLGLTRLNHGIEKEALRITPRGYISQKPHPEELGAALTHSSITTDFCEAQLELVTGVHKSVEECAQELDDIHRFVYSKIGDERLWPASMPCMLQSEKLVPIAQYGRSHAGKVKTIYRSGLGHRYGRYMQTISGLHYNFSIPNSLWTAFADLVGEQDSVELRNDSYMSLIRNFQRYSWLLVYLFGASPAVCGSFLPAAEHDLDRLDESTFYLPYATSLRMGPLGYQSSAQGDHYVSYNSLEQYTEQLMDALSHPHEPYVGIGLKTPDGEYKQLSTALLQIEAEFYRTIRPKPKPGTGLRPLEALNRFGIEYVEVRCLDLDPFQRTGFSNEIGYFIDAFLLFAWLSPSLPDSVEEWKEIQRNQLTTVRRGREPGLELVQQGESRALNNFAVEILREIELVAKVLDKAQGSHMHLDSWSKQWEKVADSATTPSARIVSQMQQQGQSYYWSIDQLANNHRYAYTSHPLSPDLLDHYDTLALQSLREQKQIEEAESTDFEDYLASYMKMDPSI